ncbi:hypothetical protein FZEAL_2543 [Fusarium zealandicum]|uniref:Uncharacterized protein n=1 Tax=Fusarium zealandicum TaxID=1053134 RepID=A0A8H4XND1_9HYPO|nr:hypothetical protein FZEAL_2543 [Fusarium zealandicum]
MYSPAKLLVAAMAFTTLGAAMPTADNADAQNIEVRAGCLGYANYSACVAGRRRACSPGAGFSQCFNTAQRVCQQNC